MAVKIAIGLIIKDKQVLVAKTHGQNFFVAPGGKINVGESTIDALKRELKEEMKIEIMHWEELGTFTSYFKNDPAKTLEMAAFIIKDFTGKITPNNEIGEITWIDSAVSPEIILGTGFAQQILPKLKQLNLIN